MHMMIERRAEDDRRIPLHVPVELRPDSYDDTFEADAIDVSRGGLAMRASCLPDVGTRFVCRFDLVPGDTPISIKGEVVWAHLTGDRRGEFGFRFVEMSNDQAALIAELIAEQGALTRPGSPPARVASAAREWSRATPAFREPAPAHRSGMLRPQAEAYAASDGQPSPTSGSVPAPTPPPRSTPAPTPPSTEEVELALDTGGELHGKLAGCDRQTATFLQSLEVLAIGQGLWLRMPDGDQQRASIADVSLRFQDGVPLLAVGVSLEDSDAAYTAQTWNGEVADAHGPASGSDTVPDATPPHASWARERTTMSEFAETRVPASTHASAGGCGDVSEAGGSANGVSFAGEPDPISVSADLAELNLEPPRGLQRAARQSRPGSVAPDVARPGEDEAGVHALEWDDGAEAEGDDPFHEGGAARPALGGASASLASAAGGVARWLGRTQERLAPGARALASRGGALTAFGHEQARILGRTARAVFGPKRRRTTGSVRRSTASGTTTRRTARARAQPGSSGRMFLVSVVAIAAIALAVYALAPRAQDEDLPLHPGVAKAPATAQEGALSTASDEGASRQDASGTAADPGADAVPVPKAVPSGSPYAVDVAAPGDSTGTRQRKPAASGGKGASAGPRFGAADVPNPSAFTLRMSQEVRSLEGIPDKGGFTVVIPDSLSLDRAGPIASRHGAIKRSMILNKGDHSELTMRFEPGKRPLYRVEAHGNSLKILLAGK